MPMSSFASSRRGALFALFVTILIWAYSWIVMKQVLAHTGPLDFVALRFLLGALILFAAMLLARQSLRPPPLLPTVLIGLFQTAVFQGTEQLALLSGGAGHVALLAYTMPFWAVLLAWLLLGDKLSTHHWLGLVLAALGLLCIMQPWHAMGSVLSNALAVGGGAAWAAGTVLSKRLFRRQRVSLLSLTAWQMLIGSAVLGVIALAVPQRPFEWSWPVVGALAYSAGLASSLAWWLWAVVLKRLSTTEASVSSLGVPIVSVLLAWLILHEQPSAMEGLGIVLVLLGLVAIGGVGTRQR